MPNPGFGPTLNKTGLGIVTGPGAAKILSRMCIVEKRVHHFNWRSKEKGEQD